MQEGKRVYKGGSPLRVPKIEMQRIREGSVIKAERFKVQWSEP